MDDLPTSVWVLVFLGVIGIPAATAGALYRGARAAGLRRRTAATVSAVAGGVWGLWIVGAAALAGAGLYREEPGAFNPWIGVVFAAVLAALLSATRIPVVARILVEPGTPGRLAWPHTLRVVGAVFLVVMALGELPAVFAVPAGLGDIAVGVAAVFVARRWAGGRHRRPAVWFNVLGIVDLAVAVGIGFLAGLGPRPVLGVNPVHGHPDRAAAGADPDNGGPAGHRAASRVAAPARRRGPGEPCGSTPVRSDRRLSAGPRMSTVDSAGDLYPRTVPEMLGLSGVVVRAHKGRPVATITGGGRTTATSFQIASVSKVFAATLAMMLVEDGKLTLLDPVDRWLPEAPPGLTLHRLLSHTAGIGHWEDIPAVHPRLPMSRDNRLALLLRAPLLFEPGASWRYSSPGYLVVGALIERAVGRPYAEILAERILQPLGLSASQAGASPADRPGNHRGEPAEAWDITSMTGTGDLWSTADDLLTYARCLEEGALVRADTLRVMRTPHAMLPETDRSLNGRLVITGYGYGLYVGEFDGRAAWLHSGDVPGYTSLLGWLPDDINVVCLSDEDTVRWEQILAEII